MFFLLVRLLAALSLGRGVHQIRIHIFSGPSSLPVGPLLLSGCIVGNGDDALKTHATNPQNQGGSAPCVRRNAPQHSWDVSVKAVLLLSRTPPDAARAEEM
jgi:hypothetical protein